MNNTIKLVSISELLEEEFFIPSYQRGYRWTKQQIEDFLEDIYSFAIKKDKTGKEFYCLQPIIVKKRIIEENDKVQYEVIDGQQRLTTIRILFSYLTKEYLFGKSIKERYGKDLYTVHYETRPESTLFLDNIDVTEEKNIDFFHIAKAYEYISTWFDNKVKKQGVMFDDACDSVLRTLVFSQKNKKEEGVVQVIWYEINDVNTNPIDVFIRTNLGKISLTNAELIKALFLQERNFGEGDAARLKQLEIAQEWDRIENELQDENFWWFLNKEENKASSHIEFIFDMQCALALKKDQEDQELEKIIGDDHYKTFRFFSTLIGNNPDYDTIKEQWDIVKSYFETFKEWYNRPEWYHYIGFLVTYGCSLQEIKDILSHSSIKTKEDATAILVSKIQKEFKKITWNEETNHHLDLSYSSNKELLRKFYLMFNLEYIVLKNTQANFIYKFPFKSFKVGKKAGESLAWDIEHINSATDNSLEKIEDQIEWLENALKDIEGMSEELRIGIEEFIKGRKTDGFDDLNKKIIDISQEGLISDYLKNSIGNLTLLDATTNRGYGNALFSTKRRIIIEKDKRGVFIPICTKNVFLKYFDGNIQSKWTESDIKNYRDFLEETMSKFIINRP